MPYKKGKKNIILLCDVKGWAWWNKSQYLKHYLSDEFNIYIDYVIGSGSSKILNRNYDLYFTYGYSYISHFARIKSDRKMTGVTAHRPLDMIKKYMKTDHVHANSIMLKKELETFHKNVHYVPNGVDENLFKLTKPIEMNGELVVGHVGKKCIQKGQDNIIIPAINKSETKSITHLNDYRNKKPYCKMYELYNNMDVFVVASDEDGTPNPALEAAACGRPIISNRIGNMPEFIIDGYNGFLVEKNVDAYVEKLEWCKRNKDKVIEMGQNARKTIEEGWTWSTQAERYREMFRKVLG
jgi:glycosyltransferase involved in cell wall biosynthesis